LNKCEYKLWVYILTAAKEKRNPGGNLVVYLHRNFWKRKWKEC